MFPIVHRPMGGQRGATPMRHLAIRCSACPEEGLLNAHTRALPDDVAAKKFTNAGWLVAAPNKRLCPNCHEAWRARHRAPAGKEQMSVSASPIVSQKVSAAPVENEDQRIRRALPEIYVELEASYDRDAKAYRDGASDALIAEKLNVPPALVRERREKDFGPLVDPPAKRARQIGDALRALRLRNVEALRKLREYKSHYDAAFEEVETTGREIDRHIAQLVAVFDNN